MSLVAPTADVTSLMPASEPEATRQERASEAAKKFETIIVQQLLSILRKTAPSAGLVGGGGMGGTTYVQMFDDAIAERMVEGGGIGLSSVLEGSMGGDAAAAAMATTHRVAYPASFGPTQDAATQGALLPGLGRRLSETANALVAGPAAARWGRDGALSPAELSSDLVTEEADGEAHFNVRDANGYAGAYKCNLFALEAARRAGFQVPVVSRPRGWGYPGATRLTRDAEDGQLEGSWGRVVTGESAGALDGGVRAGTRAFALVGRGSEGHAGHMAVVERVHEVEYGDDGEVERIVFSGWEARERGAAHLPQRTWNRYGNPGGDNARNGFRGIEIIELVPSEEGGREEIPLSERTGASLFDDFVSRSAPDDPTTLLEE